MKLKTLAEQLNLFNRLTFFINDPSCKIVYKHQKSSKFYKPHVSYSVFNANDKLLFIVTGEKLFMNGIEISFSGRTHKTLLNMTMREHTTRMLNLRQQPKENCSANLNHNS